MSTTTRTDRRREEVASLVDAKRALQKLIEFLKGRCTVLDNLLNILSEIGSTFPEEERQLILGFIELAQSGRNDLMRNLVPELQELGKYVTLPPQLAALIGEQAEEVEEPEPPSLTYGLSPGISGLFNSLASAFEADTPPKTLLDLLTNRYGKEWQTRHAIGKIQFGVLKPDASPKVVQSKQVAALHEAIVSGVTIIERFLADDNLSAPARVRDVATNCRPYWEEIKALLREWGFKIK